MRWRSGLCNDQRGRVTGASSREHYRRGNRLLIPAAIWRDRCDLAPRVSATGRADQILHLWCRSPRVGGSQICHRLARRRRSNEPNETFLIWRPNNEIAAIERFSRVLKTSWAGRVPSLHPSTPHDPAVPYGSLVSRGSRPCRKPLHVAAADGTGRRRPAGRRPDRRVSRGALRRGSCWLRGGGVRRFRGRRRASRGPSSPSCGSWTGCVRTRQRPLRRSRRARGARGRPGPR